MSEPKQQTIRALERLLTDLPRCEYLADVLALAARILANRAVLNDLFALGHQPRGGSASPGRASSARAAEVRLQSELAALLSPTGEPVMDLPASLLDAAATFIRTLSTTDRCAALIGLIGAAEALLPSYDELLSSSWIRGGPLSTKFGFGVYPRFGAPAYSPIGAYIRRQKGGPVKKTTDRTLNYLGFFEQVVLVDRKRDDHFDADVRPMDLSGPQWHLLREVTADIGTLSIGTSCLARDLEADLLELSVDRFTFKSEALYDELPSGLVPSIASALQRGRAHLWLLPEMFSSDRLEQDLLRGGDDEYPVLLIAGSRHAQRKGAMRNVARVLDHDGALLWEQFKASPARIDLAGTELQEDIEPGTIISFRDTPIGRICVLICADADNPDVLAFVGGLAPDVILVPTLNPGNQLHSIHARVSAVLPMWGSPWVLSVNSCAAQRIGQPDLPDVPPNVSFSYLPVRSKNATCWGPCGGSPGSCTRVWRLNDHA